MIALVSGVPRDVVEASPVYVGLFDSKARCESQAAASNNNTPPPAKYLFECKEERVIH
jgi:hypothetical protein